MACNGYENALDASAPNSSPGIDAYTHLPAVELGAYGERYSIDAVLQCWIYTESDELRIDLEDDLEAKNMLAGDWVYVRIAVPF